MGYKVFYKGRDAHYPEFETEEKALNFYIKDVEGRTEKTREEILKEDWPSPKGVENCVEVRKI